MSSDSTGLRGQAGPRAREFGEDQRQAQGEEPETEGQGWVVGGLLSLRM